MTKLKIDLSTGIMEVEGEEAFVREIYLDFRERLSTATPPALHVDAPGTTPASQGKRDKAQAKERVSKGSAKRKESYTIVSDLDLVTAGKEGTLKDFFTSKAPSTAQERNAVFVYFLKRGLETGAVNVNHVYTCYRHVGVRVPGALKQSLLDTAHLKGWIDTKSLDDIGTTTVGENFVVHDLPKTNSK